MNEGSSVAFGCLAVLSAPKVNTWQFTQPRCSWHGDDFYLKVVISFATQPYPFLESRRIIRVEIQCPLAPHPHAYKPGS